MPASQQPVEQKLDINGTKLTHYEWNAELKGEKPTLVLAHATGFHARAYDAIVEQFSDHHALSLDLHGHGKSEGAPIENWYEVAADVNGIIDQLGLKNAIGVGHSMGAHTLAQCADDRPGSFAKLVLFDPVILPPDLYGSGLSMFNKDNPHPSIRRKRDFASHEEMMERFVQRSPYSLFDKRVFEDYCQHGLVRTDSDGYELACSPEMESSVYTSSQSNEGIHEAVSKIDIPVLVVRAKQRDLSDFTGSPTWPELAGQFSNGTDMHRPDRTHFHPLEDPKDAARIIREFIS